MGDRSWHSQGAAVGLSRGSQPHGGCGSGTPPRWSLILLIKAATSSSSGFWEPPRTGITPPPAWGIWGLLQLPSSPSQPNTAARGSVRVSWGICWQLAAFITHGDARWGEGTEPGREAQARGVSRNKGTRDSPQSCGMGGTGWVRGDPRALEPFSICSSRRSQAVSPQRQKCAV